MSETEKQVRNIVIYIRRKLKEAGCYDPTLSYQIELVASDMLIYRKLREACLSDNFPVSTNETSREGYDRIRMNPVFSELQRQSKIVQEGLDKLTMNNKSRKEKQPSAGGGFRDFMSSMSADFVDD